MLKEIKIIGISHPIKINEDGTEIWYKDKQLKPFIIKTKKHKKGYYQCSIENKGIYIHRLVAMAFIRNPRPIVYKMVLHKDCDSLNNHHDNLEWGDRSVLTKNRKNAGITGAGNESKPEYRGSSKISHTDAVVVAKRLDAGEYARDIATEFGVSEMSINRIRKRYCKTKQVSPRYSNKIKITTMKLCLNHTPKHVSDITGIPYHTIMRWRKQVLVID